VADPTVQKVVEKLYGDPEPTEVERLRQALQDVDDHLTNCQSGDVQPGERCKLQARQIAREALADG
jgi:hypothetical protein